MSDLPITPTPPRGGVMPEPNAKPVEFKPEIDRLMTVEEAAEYVRTTRYRILTAIQGKQIRFVDLGLRSRRIWLSDLQKWLDQKAVRAAHPTKWLS